MIVFARPMESSYKLVTFQPKGESLCSTTARALFYRSSASTQPSPTARFTVAKQAPPTIHSRKSGGKIFAFGRSIDISLKRKLSNLIHAHHGATSYVITSKVCPLSLTYTRASPSSLSLSLRRHSC